ncbi:MAG: DsrE family protein [Melioribacteraceae bacterium]|nr:DsrE family protein [Melioribacteraceae bacterium]
MKLARLLVVFLFVLISFSNTSANYLPAGNDGVIIHLSNGSNDPHRALMALTLALKMADDHDVLVFLDIHAVDLVLATAKSVEYKKFEPSKILLDKLLAKGAKIIVCPMCLEVINKTKFDLIKGAELADKADFFSFTSGRIITLDY